MDYRVATTKDNIIKRGKKIIIITIQSPHVLSV